MYIIASDPLSSTLIVGQAPAQQDDPNNPISGRTGKRLAGMMGLNLDEFLLRFNRVNLIDRWPGKQGKGDAWPYVQALANAGTLQRRWFKAYGRILLLGKQVAAAVQVDRPMLEWGPNPQWPNIGLLAVMPHPSGVNRWWNDVDNVKSAAKFLAELREVT